MTTVLGRTVSSIFIAYLISGNLLLFSVPAFADGCGAINLVKAQFFVELQGQFKNSDSSATFIIPSQGYCPGESKGGVVCQYSRFIPESTGDLLCEYGRRLQAAETTLATRMPVTEQALSTLNTQVNTLIKDVRVLTNSADAATHRMDKLEERSKP